MLNVDTLNNEAFKGSEKAIEPHRISRLVNVLTHVPQLFIKVKNVVNLCKNLYNEEQTIP